VDETENGSRGGDPNPKVVGVSPMEELDPSMDAAKNGEERLGICVRLDFSGVCLLLLLLET
jgi:hypothetical protein